jgi:hypothetical protein
MEKSEIRRDAELENKKIYANPLKKTRGVWKGTKTKA